MYIAVHCDKSTPVWTIRGTICDGHLPQNLFNKYEKQCAKLVNAVAERKLTNASILIYLFNSDLLEEKKVN